MNQYSTQHLDHLGIIAGTFNLLNIKEIIDELVPSGRRNVTHGEAVKAMVLNGLGFTSRALYLTSEFFKTKPIELIREGLSPEDLSDDTLGRTLDKLYEVGVTEIFGVIATRVMRLLGQETLIGHLDSSTFSFSGSYKKVQEDPQAITITRGYSKDHRPDQVQAGLVLICEHISKLPIWMEAVDGNSSDKKQLSATLKTFKRQLQGPAPLIIMDSAFYTLENIQDHVDVGWISRPPLTIKAVQTRLHASDQEEWLGDDSLKYQEHRVTYAGVEQRWFTVYSATKHDQDERGLQKKVAREASSIEKRLKTLSSQEFDCEDDMLKAIRAFEKKLKFHRLINHKTLTKEHYETRGRPKKGAQPNRITFQLQAEFEEISSKVEEARKGQGLYLIATNQLDQETYPADRVIRMYKSQGVTVERGFRFLKDPMFFADGLFLKKPSRIMALMMVMTLCLLVYSAAEHLLRKRLAEEGETVPNQVGKPTSTPTIRRVFQVFEGIEILTINQGDHHQRLVLNIRPEHERLLSFMGPAVRKIYLGSD